jgi:hypothetical protein
MEQRLNQRFRELQRSPAMVDVASQQPANAMRRGLSVRKKLLWSIIVCSACILILFLLGEIVVRLHRGKLLSLESVRRKHMDMLRSAYPAVYDPLLGFVPRPGDTERANHWGKRVNIRADGLRSNGQQKPGKGDMILAVGDSYTFGDEVNDEETWPASLESLTGKPVLNGGVFGYGLDQMILRAEQLLKEHSAAVLVVALIPDDIRRCEFSFRYSPKPYFEIEEGALSLRNVPVPTANPNSSMVLTILGYSYLADALLTRLCPGIWLANFSKTTFAHHQGVEVSCLLIDRLAQLGTEHKLRLILVLLGHPDFDPVNNDPAMAEPVLARARQRGIAVLDLQSEMRASIKENPDLRSAWFPTFHMAPAGNTWVANRIAREISGADRPGRKP